MQGTDQAGLRHRILKIDKTLDDDGHLTISPSWLLLSETMALTSRDSARSGNLHAQPGPNAAGATPERQRIDRRMLPHARMLFWHRRSVLPLPRPGSSSPSGPGFVRFTGPFYLITIKRRLAVAMIGGHYIYHIEETQLTPITGDVPKSKAMEEAKLMAAFRSVGLSKNFYYSTFYDLTNTLQSHFTHPTSYSASQSAFPPADPSPADRKRKAPGLERRRVAWGFHDKFLWNHHLLEAAFGDSIDDEGRNPWIVPLIYGFVDQSSAFDRHVRHFEALNELVRVAQNFASSVGPSSFS